MSPDGSKIQGLKKLKGWDAGRPESLEACKLRSLQAFQLSSL
jgi:hypothetical protein